MYNQQLLLNASAHYQLLKFRFQCLGPLKAIVTSHHFRHDCVPSNTNSSYLGNTESVVIGREPPTTWLVTRRINAILKGKTRTKTTYFSNW